jgi:hypothetical protein
MPVTENLPGLDSFQQWATGDLVDNRTQGIFAEWLVGQALGEVIDLGSRMESVVPQSRSLAGAVFLISRHQPT